jgi:membrane associated rhomboid family serine protease
MVAAFQTVPSEAFFGVFEAKHRTHRPNLVFCGDDRIGKERAAQLIRDAGFEPVDAGPLRIARYIEPFAVLLAGIAYGGKAGPELAYAFEHFGKVEAAGWNWASSPLVSCDAMQFHSPDPAYTRSARDRENFRLAAKLSLGFVALLWAIPLLGWGLELQRFGVRPRQWIGVLGILVAPLLHADFLHLIANTLPLVVLGTTMLYLYPTATFRVLPAVYFGPGIAVWLFARDGNHVGASGLIYGLIAYIFVAGLIRRDRRALAAALLVAFMYGASVWGLLPIRVGVSWETHLAAALIGAAMAIALRHTDMPPPIRYSWEDETDGDPDASPATPTPGEEVETK